jgi:hypothetical protein
MPDDTTYSHIRYTMIKHLVEPGSAATYRPSREMFRVVAHQKQAAIESGSWREAIEPILFVLAVYVLVYDRHHPLIGLECVLLAKAVWNAQDDVVVVRELERVLRAATQSLLVGDHVSALGEVSQLYTALRSL